MYENSGNDSSKGLKPDARDKHQKAFVGEKRCEHVQDEIHQQAKFTLKADQEVED